MKILLTGGHHTSALAVIKELRRQESNLEVFFVGHTHSMVGDKNDSAEFKDITALGIPFFDIKAGKFYGVIHPLKLVKVLTGFYNALKLLRKLKPDCILSFGGYIAVPVVIIGYILGIPAVTHEQTVVVGMANKVISRFVSKIFITWESSRKNFDSAKVIFTGLPIREEVLKVTTSKFSFEENLPIVYITGGKQGSQTINELIFSCLAELLTFCNVLHQCGDSSVHNAVSKASELKASLSPSLIKRYVFKGYFDSSEIGEVYNKATVIVGRSGAHSVYELLALRKPCVLIPIPWVSHNEQYLNAKVLEELGLGVILEEKDLSKESLINTIKSVLQAKQANKLDSSKLPKTLENSAYLIAYETLKTAKRQ